MRFSTNFLSASVLKSEAVAEARAAAQWYRERSPLAADAFLAELDRAVERIAENPERDSVPGIGNSVI